MMMATTSILSEGGLLDWIHEIQFRGDAGSDLGRYSDFVYMVIFWLSLIAFVLLMGLMVYFAAKYRRRPGVLPQRSASHNTPLELFWTIGPLIALVWMFFYGFWGYAEAVVSPSDGVELFLRGRQWQWEVTYPNGATTGLVMSKSKDAPGFEWFHQTQSRKADAKRLGKDDRPVIVVPAGVPVKFRMISEDVLHAFWVPDFRTKLDVIPNRYTNVWFQADKEQIGDHWVFCAEYCGLDHSEMLAVLRVLPWDDYVATISEWGQPENPVDWGRLLWTNKCSTCHSKDGKPGTGPTWQGLWGKTESFTNAPDQVVDENYVRESILFPGAKITKGFKNQMTPFTSLSEEQINALIQFMKSPEVSGKAAPAPTEGGAEGKPAGGEGDAGGAAKK